MIWCGVCYDIKLMKTEEAFMKKNVLAFLKERSNFKIKNSFYVVLIVISACLTFPVSAALQYNLKSGTGEGYFSVDYHQTVYVNVKKDDGASVALGDSVISKIGWYNYDEVVNYRDFRQSNQIPPPGYGPSRPWPTVTAPTLHYGNMRTGVLGEFKPGDKIVLWVETTSADGKKETFTMYSPSSKDNDIWLLGKSGQSIVFNWGDFGVNYGKKAQESVNPEGFQFLLSSSAPSGQPLPGIIATLLVGGGSLVYLKKRKKLKAAKQ